MNENGNTSTTTDAVNWAELVAQNEAAIEAQAACMHFDKKYERDDAWVHMTCVDCGAVGRLPRCQGTTKEGKQCQGYVRGGADGCVHHSTEALAAKGERAAAKAATAAERTAKKTADRKSKLCPATKANGEPCQAYKTRSGYCKFHTDWEDFE